MDEEFNWLFYDEKEDELFCSDCCEFDKKNRFTQGCRRFRIDALQEHEICPSHR